MDRNILLRTMKERVYVLDGAMGTLLYDGKLKPPLEILNLTDPERIKQMHKAYADAGAVMILTATFGANPINLAKYGLAGKTRDINAAALRNARESCPHCLIVADIGPLGSYIEPLGNISFDEALSAYREQIKGLTSADLLIIETISDIKVLKAALIAAKELFKGPIISSVTIQHGMTVTGTSIEAYVEIASALGADIIGVNCSDGPEGMLETVRKISKLTDKPLCFQPNAGLPRIVNGNPIWNYPASRFADFAVEFVKLGASIVGGCCGTNPMHIREVARRVKQLRPKQRKLNQKLKLCSRSNCVAIEPTLIVGERINPTNRPEFVKQLKEKNSEILIEEALSQIEHGASLLDVNVAVPGLNEAELLKWAVAKLESVVDVPLVLDSSSPAAIEEALKQYPGRALINSVNGTEKSLKEVLPLAVKYGAAVIALCLDDYGLPKGVDDRVEIAKRIMKRALKLGMKKHDIVVDPVVFTKAVDEQIEEKLVKTVDKLKSLGLNIIAGVSNYSFGLPDRQYLNKHLFNVLAGLGVKLVIMNPKHLWVSTDKLEQAASNLMTFDENSTIEEKLKAAIILGLKDKVVDLVEEALKKHTALKVNDIMIGGMKIVGKKFKNKEIFLPQVIASAETMKLGFSRLKKEFKANTNKRKAKVLIATVENDIHDIGKNIMITLLQSHNFMVIDLGVNVKAEQLVKKAKQLKPDVIALSALMTTTVVHAEDIITKLRKNNIDVPVILGGAVVTRDYSESIAAHYGRDALEGIEKINELIKDAKRDNS